MITKLEWLNLILHGYELVYWLLVVLTSMLFVMICGKYETHELKKAPRCALLWRLPNLMGIKMFC